MTFFQRTAAPSPCPRSSSVPSKNPSQPVSEREELPYPKDSRDTRGPSPGASSYQDFVYVFCQEMWNCPDSISVIVEALGVQFRMHQKKYGRQIVPDRQLSELMASIAKLDAVYTCTIDSEFKGKINSDGWYSVSPIFSKHEALLVAIMSLAAENWSPIRNRHGWTNLKELKQNRCMSFTIALCDFTLLNCFKGNGICQAVADTYRARSTGGKTNTRCVFFPGGFSGIQLRLDRQQLELAGSGTEKANRIVRTARGNSKF